MDWLTVVSFFAGLALLVLGADWLVRGAARLAARAGISPLVVGLTVVAFGTSAPELAVSVKASWSGQADMAVGNVIGSNIANVLIIIGLSALITPLVVAQQLVRRDVPLAILVSVAVLGLAWDGRIGRFDGLLLCTSLVAYLVWVVRQSRRESREVAAEYAGEYGAEQSRGDSLLGSLGYVLGGLGLLVLGSNWLVDSAVTFARWLGIREVVVGLTVVAFGTSLPELATSVAAALKGERDIAVGNVVGSNLFNLLGVLGLSGLAAPDGLRVGEAMLGLDMPVMIAASFACLPFFARGSTIPRWEGGLLFLHYCAYATYLVLCATEHEARDGYAAVMLRFVLPLVGLTLGIVAFRVLRHRRV